MRLRQKNETRGGGAGRRGKEIYKLQGRASREDAEVQNEVV